MVVLAARCSLIFFLSRWFLSSYPAASLSLFAAYWLYRGAPPLTTRWQRHGTIFFLPLAWRCFFCLTSSQWTLGSACVCRHLSVTAPPQRASCLLLALRRLASSRGPESSRRLGSSPTEVSLILFWIARLLMSVLSLLLRPIRTLNFYWSVLLVSELVVDYRSMIRSLAIKTKW